MPPWVLFSLNMVATILIIACAVMHIVGRQWKFAFVWSITSVFQLAAMVLQYVIPHTTR